MTMQPTMNKTDRIVKIAEVNGHIYVDGGFHPHFQEDIKANLDAQFHKEKKIWYVKADRATELDALIETYFPTATIQDHRKKEPALPDQIAANRKKMSMSLLTLSLT